MAQAASIICGGKEIHLLGQAEILKRPIRWEDRYAIPPTEPGLGVELDEAVAAETPYDGDRLHLEMADEPV